MQCVQQTSEGFLQVAQQAASDCQLYVIQAGESLSMQSIFDPLWLTSNGGSELLRHCFWSGFNLVIAAYLAAFAYGVLINMFDSK